MHAATMVALLSPALAAGSCLGGSCVKLGDETNLLQVTHEVTQGMARHSHDKMHQSLAKKNWVSGHGAAPDKWLQASITFLNGHLQEEGIWRKSGNKETMTELVDSLPTMEETGVPPGTDVHAVSGALGRILQSDPPLNEKICKAVSGIKPDKYEALQISHYAAMRFPDFSPTAIATVRKMMDPELGFIPADKFANFHLLVCHWHAVIQHEPFNRMNLPTLTNMAIVLITPEDLMQSIFSKQPPTKNLLDMMTAAIQDPEAWFGQCPAI
jgi:hypothetical protein